MSFCNECGGLFAGSNLSKHYMKIHKKKCAALKDGETPKKPIYINCMEFIANPKDVTPNKIPDLIRCAYDSELSEESEHDATETV